MRRNYNRPAEMGLAGWLGDIDPGLTDGSGALTGAPTARHGTIPTV